MSWARLDETDGQLFRRELVGDRYSSGGVASDLTGRTADCLVGSWVGEISCWVSWARLDGTDGRPVASWVGRDILLGELGQT